MGTISPRPRGPRTQADVNRERRAGEEQVRRLVSNIPQPERAKAVPGQRGSVSLQAGGRTTETGGFRFHTWGGIVQGEDPDGVTITIDHDSASPSRYFGPSDPGYYSANVQVELIMAKAGAPARLVCELNGAAGSIVYCEDTQTQAAWKDYDASNYLVRFHSRTHVFYLPQWYSYPRLGVAISWPTPAPTISSATCDYFLTRVA